MPSLPVVPPQPGRNITLIMQSGATITLDEVTMLVIHRVSDGGPIAAITLEQKAAAQSRPLFINWGQIAAIVEEFE